MLYEQIDEAHKPISAILNWECSEGESQESYQEESDLLEISE